MTRMNLMRKFMLKMRRQREKVLEIRLTAGRRSGVRCEFDCLLFKTFLESIQYNHLKNLCQNSYLIRS